MIYRKPEIADLGSAVGAVRGLGKTGVPPDCVAPHARPSGSAYEADE